jgi:threonine synthase
MSLEPNQSWRGVIEEYRDRLPLEAGVEAVTLLEGNTPLIEAPSLARCIGYSGRLFLKYEGLNPTASFKDRGMTVAISAAKHEGAQAVICASTGNTSASAAAYAARAGLRAFVVVPEGKIALGKLSQAVVHGAAVVAISGGFDEALQLVRQIAETCKVEVVNSINPYRLQGQKTAAFEICDSLGAPPDYHFLPVGNAGNITAYWMGYIEYREAGVIPRCPRMMGFQAAGSAPIVIGTPVKDPTTVATAIRIGDPASWKGAGTARDESGGVIEAVTDAEILGAYSMLARTEGVFAEPASAASVAGLKKMVGQQRVKPTSVAVCTLTGHGLKDPTRATEQSAEPIRSNPELNEVRRALDI